MICRMLLSSIWCLLLAVLFTTTVDFVSSDHDSTIASSNSASSSSSTASASSTHSQYNGGKQGDIAHMGDLANDKNYYLHYYKNGIFELDSVLEKVFVRGKLQLDIQRKFFDDKSYNGLLGVLEGHVKQWSFVEVQLLEPTVDLGMPELLVPLSRLSASLMVLAKVHILQGQNSEALSLLERACPLQEMVPLHITATLKRQQDALLKQQPQHISSNNMNANRNKPGPGMNDKNNKKTSSFSFDGASQVPGSGPGVLNIEQAIKNLQNQFPELKGQQLVAPGIGVFNELLAQHTGGHQARQGASTTGANAPKVDPSLFLDPTNPNVAFGQHPSHFDSSVMSGSDMCYTLLTDVYRKHYGEISSESDDVTEESDDENEDDDCDYSNNHESSHGDDDGILDESHGDDDDAYEDSGHVDEPLEFDDDSDHPEAYSNSDDDIDEGEGDGDGDRDDDVYRDEGDDDDDNDDNDDYYDNDRGGADADPVGLEDSASASTATSKSTHSSTSSSSSTSSVSNSNIPSKTSSKSKLDSAIFGILSEKGIKPNNLAFPDAKILNKNKRSSISSSSNSFNGNGNNQNHRVNFNSNNNDESSRYNAGVGDEESRVLIDRHINAARAPYSHLIGQWTYSSNSQAQKATGGNSNNNVLGDGVSSSGGIGGRKSNDKKNFKGSNKNFHGNNDASVSNGKSNGYDQTLVPDILRNFPVIRLSTNRHVMSESLLLERGLVRYRAMDNIRHPHTLFCSHIRPGLYGPIIVPNQTSSSSPNSQDAKGGVQVELFRVSGRLQFYINLFIESLNTAENLRDVPVANVTSIDAAASISSDGRSEEVLLAETDRESIFNSNYSEGFSSFGARSNRSRDYLNSIVHTTEQFFEAVRMEKSGLTEDFIDLHIESVTIKVMLDIMSSGFGFIEEELASYVVKENTSKTWIDPAAQVKADYFNPKFVDSMPKQSQKLKNFLEMDDLPFDFEADDGEYFGELDSSSSSSTNDENKISSGVTENDQSTNAQGDSSQFGDTHASASDAASSLAYYNAQDFITKITNMKLKAQIRLVVLSSFALALESNYFVHRHLDTFAHKFLCLKMLDSLDNFEVIDPRGDPMSRLNLLNPNSGLGSLPGMNQQGGSTKGKRSRQRANRDRSSRSIDSDFDIDFDSEFDSTSSTQSSELSDRTSGSADVVGGASSSSLNKFNVFVLCLFSFMLYYYLTNYYKDGIRNKSQAPTETSSFIDTIYFSILDLLKHLTGGRVDNGGASSASTTLNMNHGAAPNGSASVSSGGVSTSNKGAVGSNSSKVAVSGGLGGLNSSNKSNIPSSIHKKSTSSSSSNNNSYSIGSNSAAAAPKGVSVPVPASAGNIPPAPILPSATARNTSPLNDQAIAYSSSSDKKRATFPVQPALSSQSTVVKGHLAAGGDTNGAGQESDTDQTQLNAVEEGSSSRRDSQSQNSKDSVDGDSNSGEHEEKDFRAGVNGDSGGLEINGLHAQIQSKESSAKASAMMSAFDPSDPVRKPVDPTSSSESDFKQASSLSSSSLSSSPSSVHALKPILKIPSPKHGASNLPPSSSEQDQHPSKSVKFSENVVFDKGGARSNSADTGSSSLHTPSTTVSSAHNPATQKGGKERSIEGAPIESKNDGPVLLSNSKYDSSAGLVLDDSKSTLPPSSSPGVTFSSTSGLASSSKSVNWTDNKSYSTDSHVQSQSGQSTGKYVPPIPSSSNIGYGQGGFRDARNGRTASNDPSSNRLTPSSTSSLSSTPSASPSALPSTFPAAKSSTLSLNGNVTGIGNLGPSLSSTTAQSPHYTLLKRPASITTSTPATATATSGTSASSATIATSTLSQASSNTVDVIPPGSNDAYTSVSKDRQHINTDFDSRPPGAIGSKVSNKTVISIAGGAVGSNNGVDSKEKEKEQSNGTSDSANVFGASSSAINDTIASGHATGSMSLSSLGQSSSLHGGSMPPLSSASSVSVSTSVTPATPYDFMFGGLGSFGDASLYNGVGTGIAPNNLGGNDGSDIFGSFFIDSNIGGSSSGGSGNQSFGGNGDGRVRDDNTFLNLFSTQYGSGGSSSSSGITSSSSGVGGTNTGSSSNNIGNNNSNGFGTQSSLSRPSGLGTSLGSLTDLGNLNHMNGLTTFNDFNSLNNLNNLDSSSFYGDSFLSLGSLQPSSVGGLPTASGTGLGNENQLVQITLICECLFTPPAKIKSMKIKSNLFDSTNNIFEYTLKKSFFATQWRLVLPFPALMKKLTYSYVAIDNDGNEWEDEQQQKRVIELDSNEVKYELTREDRVVSMISKAV